MKHPEREEWIPYLFGEADPVHRSRLGRHLKACPDCAAELDGWKRSLKHLDTWTLPEPEPAKVRAALFPMIGWAMAAAIVLAFGVLIGRVSFTSSLDLTELRAEIEASLRSSLESELYDAVDDLQVQVANSLGAAESRLASVSYSENQRAWRALLEIIDAYRTQDVRALQAALQRIQQQNSEQYVALRKDLETLASATDDEIRQARLSLLRLASTAAPLE